MTDPALGGEGGDETPQVVATADRLDDPVERLGAVAAEVALQCGDHADVAEVAAAGALGRLGKGLVERHADLRGGDDPV